MKKLFIAVILVLLGSLFCLNLIGDRNKITSNKTESIPEQVVKHSNILKYADCNIVNRSSMNFPSSKDTLLDKSIVQCNENGQNKTILQVADKKGFETAKNNFYRIWQNNDELFAVIVDQNGAGSGEGIGKLIAFSNDDYKVLSCFYYLPERFTGKETEELTQEEIVYINSNLQNKSNADCTNYIIKSYTD